MGLTAAELFDVLGQDYETAFAGLTAQREELEWLLDELPGRARVLDVGSGTGRPSAELLTAAGHSVTGYDVSPRMVEIAREQVPAASFEVADLRTLSFPPDSWDAITAFFTLLQVTRAEIDTALAAFASWLAPGGIFLFATVPADIENLDIEFMGQPATVSSYTQDVYRDKLAGLGFDVVRQRMVEFQPSHTEAGPEVDLFIAARKV
ncbi:class I SAM-dependent methyltransferase [Amycolatopsis panacis]|uniref:Class I SAM-dependent methyltransferase n=1 Tax=Amycolatopsis panacis TaxID=2340917 RepID=A0A419HX58_9PSEU|nr:class I SAM-dependent methyltransferase [Amycolatopsis panacis]RJQ81701.1 class I SAM-dependent methyltransferase [Amycolatopsis panacis]